MNYKQLAESATPGEWKTDGFQTITCPSQPKRVFGNKNQYSADFVVLQAGLYSSPTPDEAKANARLICHHKRHFERLVEALKGVVSAYDEHGQRSYQQVADVLSALKLARKALADADRVV